MPAIAAVELMEIFAIYLITILMYIVASPGPDPNPRGRGQLPKPNECNSMLTSATRGETLTPNPYECNSTLTSGTENIFYPYPYIYADERGHRLWILHVPWLNIKYPWWWASPSIVIS